MLLWLALDLALAGPAADQALAEGVAAQKAGDVAAAKEAYARCLAAEPDHVGCHWEKGWSHWSKNEWDLVVGEWREVKRLAPEHPDLEKWLSTAETHVASLERMRAAAASAPDTVRAPVPAGKTVRIRMTGDVMMGSTYPDPTAHLPPEDGANLLAGVGGLLRDADLTFGNLEGPLCDDGTTEKCSPGQNCYAFRSPTRYGRYLKDVGYDFLSTANNHAMDFGEHCLGVTHQTLDALGIRWSGPPGTFATVEHDGLKVGVVGFHTAPTSNFVNDHALAAALVRSVAARHDLVVVTFHGGAEGSKALHVPKGNETFYGEDRGHLRAFARAVVEAGADLVYGHGPHVPRGMELIDGHLVAYSLGNFATYGRFSLGGHLSTSLVLEAVLDHEGRLVRGRILPVRLEGAGVPVPDPENTSIDLIRSLSAEDFAETGPIIAQDGSFAPR